MSVNQTNIPHFISDDKVIQFFKSSDIRKNPKAFDLPTVSQWYEEDPDNRHLGDLSFFQQKNTIQTGLSLDLLKNKQTMTVGSEGTFTYDVPFYEEENCMTVRDTSDQAYPGIDGTTFKIVLSDEFTTGDILSSDPMYGDQFIVTDEVVVQKGDGFEHVVQLVTNDKSEYFMAENLRDGISYYKVSHAIFGERGTNYSNITMPNKTSKMRCEFMLGNESGVETYLTAKADLAMRMGKADMHTVDYVKEINDSMDNFAMKHGDVAMLYDRLPNGNINPKSARLAPTLEILIRREHNKLIDQKLMFQRAGTIRNSHGITRMNEGLWWQLRRGKIIKYSRPGGMTRAHIKEAMEYIFRGNDLQDIDRMAEFECGTQMYENFIEIFSDEVNAQLDRLSNVTNLLGTDGQIPMSPIKGKDLANLTLKAVRFVEVYIPGTGNVKVKRNIALDYLGDTSDRFSGGMHPSRKTHGAYCAIIWDAKNQAYSNNKMMPEGTKIVEGGKDNASIYLVKHDGPLIFSGFEQGRYSHNTSQNILSSLKQRGVNYWSWDSGVAVFLADPTAFVMIELDRAGRRGYV